MILKILIGYKYEWILINCIFVFQFAGTGYGGKADIYLISGQDGTVTPPSSYDTLSLEERSNLLANVCGVITAGAKKICTRSLRCPIHTDTQRREIRMRWLSNDEEIDIDR